MDNKFSIVDNKIQFKYPDFTGSIVATQVPCIYGGTVIVYEVAIIRNDTLKKSRHDTLEKAFLYVEGYNDQILAETWQKTELENIERGKHLNIPVPKGTKWIYVELKNAYEGEQYVNSFKISDPDFLHFWDDNKTYFVTAFDKKDEPIGDNNDGEYTE